MQRKGNYNQAGPNNNHWRGGISAPYYQRIAYEHYGKVCQCCYGEAVLVHHKDEDRYNNDLDNLEPFCKRCHQVYVHNCLASLPEKVEFKPKACVECGRTFQPPGPRSTRCDDCLPEKNIRKRERRKRRKQAKV